MKKYFEIYLNAYRGLTTPAWMLALVIFINRSGAMVLPFLGVYMTNHLEFSIQEAGVVLSCYGLGAVAGAWVGGWLTDNWGHFKTQAASMFATVPLFCVLPELTSVETLSAGIFILSFVADIFRPANSASVSYYAKPENITKAFSLNRMAINLGFSVGPALGGFLATISYSWLFYGNAVGALGAGLLFYFYFNGRKGNRREPAKEKEVVRNEKLASPYKDKRFLIFSGLCAIYAVCFFQLLSTLPLYYKNVHFLNEKQIGMILAFSGIIVFSLEMLLVHIAERRMRPLSVIILGTLLCGLSYMFLNTGSGLWVLYVSMFILCISEILALPFMATVAVQQSVEANRGAYMGLSTLSFSVAHIISPYVGTKVADSFGFETLWWGTGILTLLASAGFYWLIKTRKSQA